MSEALPPALHIGEVAGVASTLVSGLVDADWPAEHRTMPAPSAKSGLAAKLVTAGPRVSAARALRSELHSRGAIAHVHFATSGVFFLGSHPLVVHCHGSDVRNPRAPLKPLLSMVLTSADLVIAATPDLTEHLPSTAVYLPNPVDTAAFAPTEQERDRDVLIFAALTDIKGARELLEMAVRIRELRPSTSVSAIAHGGWAPRFADAGVEMLPFVDPSELPGLLRRFRVVVGQRVLGVPGTSELQAMASGIPVVMPLRDDLDDVWSPPPVLGGDTAAAATAVVELLDDDDWRRSVADDGLGWVRTNHSLEAVTDRLVQLYRGLG